MRMSGKAAANGLVQLRRMTAWHAKRNQNAAVLAETFSDCPALRVPMPGPEITHAWYRFYAFLRPERLRAGWDRDRILSEMAARGQIGFSGSCPEIYNEGVFRLRGFTPSVPLPVAHELGHTSLAFRVDPTLSARDMQRMADTVCDILARATK